MSRKAFILCTVLISLLLGYSVASAEVVRVAVGRSQPPYFIVDQDRGIQHDIIKEALAFRGHEMTAFYVPNPRAAALIKDGRVEASAVIRPGLGFDDILTDPVISYQNVLITRAEDGLALNSLEDLAGYRVVAFKSATKLLGERFAKAVQKAGSYEEVVNQIAQVRMLYERRADIVVSDRNIFAYYVRQSVTENKIDQEFDYKMHPVFPPTVYYLAVPGEGIRRDFNEGLKKLRDTGRYKEIFSSYAEEFDASEADYPLN